MSAAVTTGRYLCEFAFEDMRGASDHTPCGWNVVIIAAGATDDGWESSRELPTMTLTATASELEHMVHTMVDHGLFGRIEIPRRGADPAVWTADRVYVTAVRVV